MEELLLEDLTKTKEVNELSQLTERSQSIAEEFSIPPASIGELYNDPTIDVVQHFAVRAIVYDMLKGYEAVNFNGVTIKRDPVKELLGQYNDDSVFDAMMRLATENSKEIIRREREDKLYL